MIVSFPEWKSDLTKRGILRKLASIYDPLGFTSPINLGGKSLYRSLCCEKLAWDAELTGTLNSSGKGGNKVYQSMVAWLW